MTQSIKVNGREKGKTLKDMDEESKSGRMEVSMKVNGETIKLTAKED